MEKSLRKNKRCARLSALTFRVLTTALLLTVLAAASGLQAADDTTPAPTTPPAATATDATANPTAAAPSSAPAPMPAVTVSSTYRLAPYDVIDVSIYGEDDLHTRARLGADGSALLPLIGNVDLAGKTVASANEAIQKKYAGGFVKDPHVLLTVIDYRKETFSILGQVSRPGIYEIPEGSHLNIVDAVLFAGGFNRTANKNGVKVKRMVSGRAKIFKVKAGSMADDSDVPPFLVLPGDIITVQESWW